MRVKFGNLVKLDMPNINIAVSEELLQKIRVKCAVMGKTQKEWIVLLLCREVENSEERARKSVKARVAIGLSSSESPAEQVGGGHLAARGAVTGAPESAPTKVRSGGIPPVCMNHKKVMKDFGNMWLCEGPPQHKELK